MIYCWKEALLNIFIFLIFPASPIIQNPSINNIREKIPNPFIPTPPIIRYSTAHTRIKNLIGDQSCLIFMLFTHIQRFIQNLVKHIWCRVLRNSQTSPEYFFYRLSKFADCLNSLIHWFPLIILPKSCSANHLLIKHMVKTLHGTCRRIYRPVFFRSRERI